jgi:hypothetical protein
MKQTMTMKWITAAALLLLASGAAMAQSQNTSLGDYARGIRKNKPATNAASQHYDNDNLPTNGALSVVGPSPSPSGAPGSPAANGASAAPAASAGAAAPAADKQKANEELQKKIDAEKAKLDSLTHDLDLEQREYRMRAAVFYSDAGNRLRDAADWDKQDAQYKSDMESKQKAIESAKEQLTQLQEDAHKAGIEEKKEDTSDKDKKDTTKEDDSEKK